MAWEVPTNWGKKVPVYPGDNLGEEAAEKLARIVVRPRSTVEA